MATVTEIDQARQEVRDDLVGAGLLIPSGVDGIYGRSGTFEGVLEQLDDFIFSHARDDGADIMRFPPVMTKRNLEVSGYMQSFPQLAGAVHSFMGNEREHAELLVAYEAGAGWGASLRQTEAVLIPAACYPIYPVLSGALRDGGRLIDVLSYCFRHEPSPDPTRLQSFRMHEHVRLGLAEEVQSWRSTWMKRVPAILGLLRLDGRPEIANDPFYGRAGKLLGRNQRDQALKIEFVIPITSAEQPTACISINYHQDHFGQLFGINTADGQVAHTSCIGFGLERLTIALFRRHGLTPADWPDEVRRALSM